MARRALVTETAVGAWGEGSATFSADRVFRYTLTRIWDPAAPIVNFLMLNPSTADAFGLDPTNRRCAGFARGWGFGGLVTTNLFAFRSTDPSALRATHDPIGERNDEVLAGVAEAADLVVAAWGTHGSIGARDEQVVELLTGRGVDLTLLRRTRGGHPGHPLYLPGDLRPVPW